MTLRPGEQEGGIRPGQLVGVTVSREQGLHARLTGEDAGDLPDMEPARVERGDPGVGAKEVGEGRQVLEAGRTVCEQEAGRPLLGDR